MMFLELALFLAPYVLCAMAGAYLEYKFGSKALADVKAAVARVEAALAAVKKAV